MYSLYELLYMFFYEHVFNCRNGETPLDINSVYYQVGYMYNDGTFSPLYTTLEDWLCNTATIISLIIIVVLCCLFVYKIIKLIGGLIR